MSPEIKELLTLSRTSLVHTGVMLLPELHFLAPSVLHYKLSRAMVQITNSCIIALPREMGKTVYVWETFATWNILNRKYKNIVYVASSLDKGKKAFRNLKKAIQNSPFVSQCFTIKKNGDTTTSLSYTIDSVDYIISVFGVGQNLRGERDGANRPDMIILDDIENKTEVRNPENRAKLREWFYGDVVPMGASARVFVAGTVLHDDGLIAKLIYDPPVDPNTGKPWTALRYAVTDDQGVSNWPEKYSDEWIQRRRSDLVSKGQASVWDNEYMNVAVSRANRVLHAADLRPYTENQHRIAKTAVVERLTVVDPGIRDGDKHDSTVIITAIKDEYDQIWIEEVRRFKGEKSRILTEIRAAYKELRPRCVYVEAVQAQWYLLQDLINGDGDVPIHAKDIPSKMVAVGKTRIEGLQPYLSNNRILYPEDASWLPDLANELNNYPKGAHDDIIDTLAYLVLLFRVHVGRGSQLITPSTLASTTTF